jgi:hypothetical protein
MLKRSSLACQMTRRLQRSSWRKVQPSSQDLRYLPFQLRLYQLALVKSRKSTPMPESEVLKTCLSSVHDLDSRHDSCNMILMQVGRALQFVCVQEDDLQIDQPATPPK